MPDVLLLLKSSTKIGEISDMTKCFENFVSQALGFLTSFCAAELRNYMKTAYVVLKLWLNCISCANMSCAIAK